MVTGTEMDQHLDLMKNLAKDKMDELFEQNPDIIQQKCMTAYKALEKKWMEEYDRFKKQNEKYRQDLAKLEINYFHITNSGEYIDGVFTEHDKLLNYVKMGRDFETMLSAIKANPMLKNQWDELVLTMGLMR